jgi:hypothetical protein
LGERASNLRFPQRDTSEGLAIAPGGSPLFSGIALSKLCQVTVIVCPESGRPWRRAMAKTIHRLGKPYRAAGVELP